MNTQPSPRWRRRKDDRPQEIVEAALESFAERGFAATRLDDIARRAGVTRGTLYLYFPSKEDLFKAVIRQSLVPILSRAEQSIADAKGPTADLLSRLIQSFPLAVKDGAATAIPKLIIAEAQNFPDLARFYLDEVVSRGRALIATIVRRGIERGEFRAVDLDHVAYCVMAPLLLTALWRHSLGLYDPGGLDPQALCRLHVDLLLRGLTVRKEAP